MCSLNQYVSFNMYTKILVKIEIWYCSSNHGYLSTKTNPKVIVPHFGNLFTGNLFKENHTSILSSVSTILVSSANIDMWLRSKIFGHHSFIKILFDCYSQRHCGLRGAHMVTFFFIFRRFRGMCQPSNLRQISQNR